MMPAAPVHFGGGHLLRTVLNRRGGAGVPSPETLKSPIHIVIATLPNAALQWRMPRDPFIREKFTRLRITARKLAAEYFERFPKERYQTEIENWQNIEFVMKRLREPIERATEIAK